jgi:hypothetical protein
LLLDAKAAAEPRAINIARLAAPTAFFEYRSIVFLLPFSASYARFVNLIDSGNVRRR